MKNVWIGIFIMTIYLAMAGCGGNGGKEEATAPTGAKSSAAASIAVTPPMPEVMQARPVTTPPK